MNYQETLNWMFEQLPMYQRQGAFAYKADLSNTYTLVNHLGNPENKFKTVHIAGTNGKGSCSHMLASVLQEAGCKVGLYTSPHLKDFRERIRINGEVIPQNEVIDFVRENKAFLEQHQLSFFEMTVGMAFQYFAEEKVDIAVIEVGLGGRLDSTNIITPEVAVITNIGLDHTQFLGTTLGSIAAEKAGIIKPKIPTVIGETLPETKSVFQQKAALEKSELYFAENFEETLLQSDLRGGYQQENIRTVQQVVQVLIEKKWKIDGIHLEKGLLNVVKNTGLMGRWQVIGEKPTIICDTAHNKEGLSLVMKQLLEQKYNELHIILGVVNDKDLESILPFFPTNAKYYFTSPQIKRAMDVEILQKKANQFGLTGEKYHSVSLAYKAAKQNASCYDLIYVGGSTFVVAEII